VSRIVAARIRHSRKSGRDQLRTLKPRDEIQRLEHYVGAVTLADPGVLQ